MRQRRCEDAVITLVGEMPRPDVTKIPASVSMMFGKLLLAEVQNYFSEPGVQEEYQNWLAARKAKGRVQEGAV